MMKPPVFDTTWSAELKALYDHDVREIWDKSLAPQVWNQYHNQLQLYFDLAGPAGEKPKKILDVGCAQATLALQLAERGHHVVAVDIRPAFLDYAKTRYTHGSIRFVVGNALDLDLDEQFDLVFANQIIEHLVYPDRLLTRLVGLLARCGQLVVTTPNWHYVLNRLPSFSELGDPINHEHKQFTADADGHFFAYRADELSNLFRDQGLSHVETRFFETPIISGHMKIRFLHGFLPAGLLRSLDRLIIATPIGRLFSHQLMVIGSRP